MGGLFVKFGECKWGEIVSVEYRDFTKSLVLFAIKNTFGSFFKGKL